MVHGTKRWRHSTKFRWITLVGLQAISLKRWILVATKEWWLSTMTSRLNFIGLAKGSTRDLVGTFTLPLARTEVVIAWGSSGSGLIRAWSSQNFSVYIGPNFSNIENRRVYSRRARTWKLGSIPAPSIRHSLSKYICTRFRSWKSYFPICT